MKDETIIKILVGFALAGFLGVGVSVFNNKLKDLAQDYADLREEVEMQAEAMKELAGLTLWEEKRGCQATYSKDIYRYVGEDKETAYHWWRTCMAILEEPTKTNQ